MVIAIVQARMSSTRLPGKVLADVYGRPMLWRVVSRLGRARLVDKVLVATSENPSDDAIARFCEQEGICCFRGSETDVLDRYYQAARAHHADVVVRITSDCPLIDSVVVDKVVERFLNGRFDYVSNALRYTYPDGLDTEVFSFEVLDQAWREATKNSEREHVTPYLRSGKFRVENVENDRLLPRKLRWTVDEPADLEFVRKVYAGFSGKDHFGMTEVLNFLSHESTLQELNSSVLSNDGYCGSLYLEAAAGAAP